MIYKSRLKPVTGLARKFQPDIASFRWGGGQEALRGSYPWLVNRNLKCGAALIRKDWILTAGHCEFYVGDFVDFNRFNIFEPFEQGV